MPNTGPLNSTSINSAGGQSGIGPPIPLPNPLLSPNFRMAYKGQQTLYNRKKLKYQAMLTKDITSRLKYDEFTRLYDRVSVPWVELNRLDEHSQIAWSEFESKLNCNIGIPWVQLFKQDKHRSMPWDFFTRFNQKTEIVWNCPPPKDQSSRFPWDDDTVPKDCKVTAPYRALPPLDEHLMTQWGLEIWRQLCLLGSDPRCVQQPTGGPIIPQGPTDAYPSFPHPPFTINPILPVYLIMHTITVVKLPERTPIEVGKINMSLDIDSWSWLFSIQVLTELDVNLVRPDSTVKEIEVNIDGYIWEFIVESYRDNMRFNQSNYSISGRSKTAYLAAPYVLPGSFTETTQKLANQLIDNELLNTGFIANYNTVDWLVDANAFTYNNLTRMEAVLKVSNSIGGVILPHKSNNEIDINARYQFSPWAWTLETPVATITKDIIREISGSWQPKPEINAVYVSGRSVGVNCFVKRTGTAGDKLGQQVLSDLITHADAGRERGRNIIADQGNQEVISLDVPLMPPGQVPGVYDPGDLLEIDEGAGNVWKGMVLGVAIDASIVNKAISVSQKITLERHHSTV